GLSARLADGSTIEVADLPAKAALWSRFRGEVRIQVLKGGAKRRSYVQSDILLDHPVPVVGDAPSAPMDPNWRDAADYSGPPPTWPRASTVLLAFGEVLRLEELPREAFRPAVELLATVWSAVVAADVNNEPRMLREVRRSMKGQAPEALVELLIERKRAEFAEDPRIIMVSDITWTNGQANVNVHFSVARGH
ncbi:MAG: hypothetical protein ACI8PZ_005391, partial [Myxococcota bacterium]